jgi:hypothetical protein
LDDENFLFRFWSRMSIMFDFAKVEKGHEKRDCGEGGKGEGLNNVIENLPTKKLYDLSLVFNVGDFIVKLRMRWWYLPKIEEFVNEKMAF